MHYYVLLIRQGSKRHLPALRGKYSEEPGHASAFGGAGGGVSHGHLLIFFYEI